MKVKKISTHPEEIIVDLVLCPKTKLYLQSLYCHRCGYFESDEKSSINCDYKNPYNDGSDPYKDGLIKLISEIKYNKEKSVDQLENINQKDPTDLSLNLFKNELSREIKKRKNYLLSS